MQYHRRLIEPKLRSYVESLACTLVVGDARSIRVFQEKVDAAAMPGLIIYAGDDVCQLIDRCAAAPFDPTP